MVRTLSERMMIRAKGKGATRKTKNFAQFLAHRAQIKQALADGWSVLQIWQTLNQEGIISTGYAAFCKQVNHWIDPRGIRTTRIQVDTPVTATKTKRSNIDGFTFDSTPNKEDLL